MTFVFYVSRPTFFEMREREKTNKPPKNKHGTSKRKYENVMVVRSVRRWYLWHHWWNQATSLPTGTLARSASKKKTTELVQISSAAFLRLLSSLSACHLARAHRDSECAQESDQAAVGPPAPSFCPGQSVAHKVYAKHFLSPRRYVHESTMKSPSSACVAPMKRLTRLSRWDHESVEERCTAKNNFKTNCISLHNTACQTNVLRRAISASLSLSLSLSLLLSLSLSLSSLSPLSLSLCDSQRANLSGCTVKSLFSAPALIYVNPCRTTGERRLK